MAVWRQEKNRVRKHLETLTRKNPGQRTMVSNVSEYCSLTLIMLILRIYITNHTSYKKTVRVGVRRKELL